MEWHVLYKDGTEEYITAQSQNELLAQCIQQPVSIRLVYNFDCIHDLEEKRKRIVELEKQIEIIKTELGEEEFNRRILSAFENAIGEIQCGES